VGRVALRYSAGLIALYLLVFYSTGSGVLLTQGSAGGAGLVRAFQGR